MLEEDYSFPPVIPDNPKVLVLGSLPGQLSLKKQEYYAFPQNAFWRIWQELKGIDAQSAYPLRIQGLEQAGIALWDVCKSAVRPGSLDQHIKKEVPNNIPELLSHQPKIACIAFNGQMPAKLFKKHIGKVQIETITLLSTSPANAAYSFEDKLSSWKQLLPYLED